MHTPITTHSYQPSFNKLHSTSLWSRFIDWADSQEKNRLGWTAFILTAHGCVITIATIFAIVYAGNPFIFWPFTIGSIAACLIVNLAALPTRITIPVFFFSLLINLTIIVLCLMEGFNSTAILI